MSNEEKQFILFFEETKTWRKKYVAFVLGHFHFDTPK